jgi:hypothetical protein
MMIQAHGPQSRKSATGREPPNLSALREKLLLLTCEHKLPANERVIAGTVEVYSTFHDVRYQVWWESEAAPGEITASRIPTTISARSFCWWLGAWWERSTDGKHRPLTFVPGGFQRIPDSFVDWVPAQLWVRELHWIPDARNPLVWTKDGRPVARYERLHGAVRNTQRYHHRQPLLSRWIVTEAGWEGVVDRLGAMRRSDDIEHAESPEV